MKRNTQIPNQFAVILGFLSLVLCGCATMSHDNSYRYVHPTVAVFKFENKAGRPMKWDLGNGMTDQMVTSLMEVGRFTVVEREDLHAILKELDLQNTGKTRPEGKVPHHRIKNVRYLIKGTISDFSHIGRGGMGVGTRSTRIRGRGNTAIVSMVITVIDVESGEIVLSATASAKVRGRGFDVAAGYEEVSFGGHAFYRTPLGKATRKAMGDAIEEIVEAIGKEIWRPAIISIDGDRITLNGGSDRRLKVGALFHIMEPGEEIYDTETGNLLGTTPGEKIGIVEVTDVDDKFAYVRLKEGGAGEIGFRLERLSSQEKAVFKQKHSRGL